MNIKSYKNGICTCGHKVIKISKSMAKRVLNKETNDFEESELFMCEGCKQVYAIAQFNISTKDIELREIDDLRGFKKIDGKTK